MDEKKKGLKKEKEIVPFTARVLALVIIRGMKFTISLIEKALREEKT